MTLIERIEAAENGDLEATNRDLASRLTAAEAEVERLRGASLNAATALEVMGLSEAVSVVGARDLKSEALTVANRLRQALTPKETT